MTIPGTLTSFRRNLVFRILGFLTVPFYPLLCLLVLDYMNFRGSGATLRLFWSRHPRSAAFSVVVSFFLFLILTLLLRKLWRSATVLCILSLSFSYINYMKLTLNGDHFFPQDIFMAGQAKELSSFLSGALPRYFFPAAAVLILWAFLFWLLDLSFPRHFFPRWSAAALLVLMAFNATCTPQKSEQLLNRFGMSSTDAALQSSNYAANGFTSAFIINIFTSQISPPAGYSQSTIQALLDDYQTISATWEEPFDIVLVLSESFFDPRILDGISFSQNPLPNYDRLVTDPNCQSGMIYTTALGGGTVRPEFNILTGLTTDYLNNAPTPYQYVDKNVPSFVSLLKESGYATIALHPYDKKFYSRNTAYPLLGFDAFYDASDMKTLVDQVNWERSYISDATTAQAIMNLVDSQDTPTFLFTITMENHQPYKELPREDIEISVNAPALSEPALSALTTYTQGLQDADRMLGTLADWVDSREKPTVLIFYGDHLPTLGPSQLAYNETGFVNNSDGLNAEERLKLYSTPFVIYSNRELSDTLLHSGSGNHISSYNLFNSALMSIGCQQTPYMQLLGDFYQTTPFYNKVLNIPKTESISYYDRAMELIAYDRVLGKRWSSRITLLH